MKTTTSKNTYQFTLVLGQVDEETPHLEDSLFEAGCDDALINFRDGTVYLDFDREAPSFKEAVMSAIRAVESLPMGAIVVSVAPENWVTESEIAERTNKGRQTVSLWTKGQRRKFFPKPVMKLSNRSPLWNWREVVEWLYLNQCTDKSELTKAELVEDLNVVLSERNPKTRKSRQLLLKEFTAQKYR